MSSLREEVWSERSNQAQWVPVSHLGMKLGGREETEESWKKQSARWETRREWFTEAVEERF